MPTEPQANRKKLAKKLKNKFRLVVLNDDNFEERWSFRLSPLNVFTWGGLLILTVIGIVIGLVAFTPLREYIPGYSDIETKKNASYAVFKADSLEAEVQMRDRYLYNIRLILSGQIRPDSIDNIRDTSLVAEQMAYERSLEDSIFREQVERDDAFSLNNANDDRLDSYFFFRPIKGTISQSFDADASHFGVDVVTQKDEAIKTILDGRVILAEWTSNSGHVIQIQHSNNLVSVYKHCSTLLKEVGQTVKAGDPIAVVGNSGELTNGPHLHLELWDNGMAVDPEKYLSF